MPVILLVEDSRDMSDLWEIGLKLENPKLEVVKANSINQARSAFERCGDLKVVVFDGSIRGSDEKPNTVELVRLFKQAFSGPMIAASNDSDHQRLLMQAGCTCQCKKLEVPTVVLEKLKRLGI